MTHLQKERGRTVPSLYIFKKEVPRSVKMFSDCSGPCAICLCANLCLAGNGDDDFVIASADEIINRLQNNKYPLYRDVMIETLKKEYNIDYRNKEET